MTKSETREVLKLQAWSRFPNPDVGLLARSYSALIRSARSNATKNKIVVFAGGLPAVVQHADFIA